MSTAQQRQCIIWHFKVLHFLKGLLVHTTNSDFCTCLMTGVKTKSRICQSPVQGDQVSKFLTNCAIVYVFVLIHFGKFFFKTYRNILWLFFPNSTFCMY
jgi:hypothetical protein